MCWEFFVGDRLVVIRVAQFTAGVRLQIICFSRAKGSFKVFLWWWWTTVSWGVEEVFLGLL